MILQGIHAIQDFLFDLTIFFTIVTNAFNRGTVIRRKELFQVYLLISE